MRISLLGPLEVTLDGYVVDLGPPRQRAVLAVLLTEPNRVLATDRIVELLWDDPTDSIVPTLQVYISNLRRALEPDRAPRAPATRLVSRSPGYSVVVGPGELDSADFEALAADGRRWLDDDPQRAAKLLNEALDLWRGAAFGEFATHRFALPEASRLEELRLATLEDRFEAELALGRPSALVSDLERAVDEHARRERLRGQLMIALYRAGRHTDALRVYEEGRQRLVEELGLDPGPELRRLERAILDHDLSVLGPPEPSRGEGPRASASASVPVDGGLPAAAEVRRLGPLVGRSEVMNHLVDRWSAALEGSGGLVALVGEPGIGKTRLASELAETVHRGGGRVLWGRCSPEPLTVYQPFVEALRPIAPVPDVAPAQALAAGLPALVLLFGDPGGTGATGHSNREVDRYVLFDAVVALLREVCRSQPSLLVLEDLHWADASTAMLMAHLARHLADQRLLVVTTARSDESGHDHPYTRHLADLRRERLVDRLRLDGLDEDATDELAEHLSTEVPTADGGALHQLTGGNPFFIEELVAHAAECGDAELSARSLPDGVRDVLELRLDRFDPTARRILGGAAVLGREFDVGLVARVTGSAPGDVLDVVEQAATAHLLHELTQPVGRFAFTHALVRQVLLDGMSAARRGQLHRMTAEVIEQDGGGDADAEIAYHLLQSGIDEVLPDAVVHLHRAAQRSQEVSSHDEAIAACRQALAISPIEPELRADVLITLGAALGARGDLDDSRAAYFEAAELALALGDVNRLSQAATSSGLASGIGVALRFGFVDEQRLVLLEAALDMLDGADPAQEVWLLSYLGVALYHSPDVTRREEVTKRAVALAQESGQARLLSAAYIARRVALFTPDHPLPERLHAGREALLHGDRSGEIYLRIVPRIALLADLLEDADLEGFDAMTADAAALVEPLRQPRLQWFLDVARAGRVLMAGQYAEARRRVDGALAAVGQALGPTPYSSYVLQHVLLERDLTGLEASRERLTAGGMRLLAVPVLDAARALTHVELGDLDRAEAVYRPHADAGFVDVPRDFMWYLTMAWFGEVACRLDDLVGAAAADGQLSGFESRLAINGGAGASGCLGRVRGLIALARGDVEQAVTLLRDALALHQRIDADPWVARTAVELAAALQATGRNGEAKELWNRATGIAEATGLVLPEPPAVP